MPAPADSPNSVTRSGSPPNAAMLSRTHSQRQQDVAQPKVGVEPASCSAEGRQIQEAQRADPVVDGDDDDVAAGGQHPPVIQRLVRRTEDVGAAVNPHHDGLAVAAGDIRRRPNVEREAVVTLRCAEVDGDAGSTGCGQTGPSALASAISVHVSGDSGHATAGLLTGGAA